MLNDLHQKVQACHLRRNAYLYVRQSTLRQVFENTESTKRPQTKLSGLAAQQRAAIIRQRIEAIVVRRAPQVMVKVTGDGRGMMAIAAPLSLHQQERPARHRGRARRDPSSADAKSSQLAQPGRAGG
jgi:hypothetical protein